MDSDDELLAGVPGPEAGEVGNKKRKLSEGDGTGAADKKGKHSLSDEGENFSSDDESKGEGVFSGSDDEPEEEDVNEYVEDGFVVRDGADDSGSEDDTPKEKRKKVERKRLKKNKDKVMLDDDDLAIVQENLADDGASRKRAEDVSGGDDEADDEAGADDEIAPEAATFKQQHELDGDNEMDDFIVDGEDEGEDGSAGGADAAPAPRRTVAATRAPARLAGGPTTDEIQESMDIFGIENLDDLDLDDDDDDDEGGYDEDGNVLAQTRDKPVVANVGRTNNIERMTLIDNFYTDKDEVIRAVDMPERMVDLYADRVTPDENELKDEADWVVEKLAEALVKDTSSPQSVRETSMSVLKDQLQLPVQAVLRFVLLEKLEVPFIWAHRRDYLHPAMTRQHLWQVVNLDQKWDSMYGARQRLLQDIDSIYRAFDLGSDEFRLDQEVRRSDILNLRGMCAEQEKLVLTWTEEMTASMDIIDRADDDESPEVESEREKVAELQKRLSEINEELSKTREDLASKHAEQEKQQELSLALEQYSSNGITEVKEAFPRERYEPIIEVCNDEQQLRDVQAYLSLLLKGAVKDKGNNINTLSTAPPSVGGATDGEKSDDAEQAAAAAVEPVAGVRPKKRSGAQFHDKMFQYVRFRKLAGLRDVIRQVYLSSADMGEAVRHGIATDLPPTLVGGKDEFDQLLLQLVDGQVVRTVEDASKALTTVVACELAHEPSVKRAVRDKFREICTVSTSPTAKGVADISPFSEHFGLQCLRAKPLLDFFDTATGGPTLFLRLLQAEKEGLLAISIEHPLGQNGMGMDIFPYFQDLSFSEKWFPSSAADQEQYPVMRQLLDMLRLDALNEALNSHFIPSLMAETRRELMRAGKESVVDEASANFAKMLEIGPYKPPALDARDAMRDTLIMCPYRPFYATVVSINMEPGPRQPLTMVYLDKEGVLCASDFIPAKAMGKKAEMLERFLTLHKPDVVVLNSSGGTVAKQTLSQLERSILPKIKDAAAAAKKKRADEGNDWDDDDDTPAYEPQAMLLKDDIAVIFKQSERSRKMFPDFQPIMRAAICLGRFAQEPLAEYCNLWTSASSNGLFGFEALFLKLHPMLAWTKSLRSQLLTALERQLVGAVCDVGVDVNAINQHEHLSSMLAFVGGLGLRKANQLRAAIREKVKVVSSRVELLERRLLKLNVWTNAASFLRVEDMGQSNADVNPFDNTRIHPECYHTHEWAPKICANAMDNEDWTEGQEYYQIVHDVRRDSKVVLEKKVVEGKKVGGRSKAYLDMWIHGGRPTLGVTTYKENIMTAAQVTEERVRQCELSDKLSVLLLDEYCAALEEKGEGRHKLQFDAIKEEVRFPWLDLRKPLLAPDVHEMFTILTGENDTSLHVGIKMGCQVLQVEERSFYDAATGETRTRPQALVKTDCGLRGKISMHEVTDERVDENNFDMHNFVQAGQRLLAVVVGVDKFRQNLDLSIKPALLREEQDYWIKQRNYNRQVQKWFGSTKSVPMHDLTKLYMPHFNEEEALRLYRDALAQASGPAAGDAVAVASGSGTKRSGGGRVANQRHIIHQLFVNCGHAEAEERLCATLDDGAVKYDGNVIVRPSSKGVDSLSITWAFNLAARQFMHFEVEERGKAPGSLGLGNELYIKYGGDAHSNEPYSDLDEIYIRFIDPLNDFAALMSKYKHFREGTAQEVEEYLAVRQQEEPGKVPYCIRYETNMPGCYVLTWYSQKSSNPIKRAKITLLPTGYEMEKRTFARPSDIIDFLKQHVGGQAPPKKRSSASSGARRSRFSDR